jgi:hypothetical protein
MADYDSPWKEALERYFPEFMAFFFPAAHADIAWERGYDFLDKELEKVVRDAELGRRLVDKLARVRQREGGERLVLVHIEVQGEEDPDFAKRMYVYNYRLFDRYDCPVVSLAVLGDDRTGWRPDRFGYALWGCEVGIRFPVVKLLDYAQAAEQMAGGGNPFRVLVTAHLKARETARDSQRRLRWKLALVKGLYEGGLGREDILELFRFIDWVLTLPAELEQRFLAEIQDWEEERKMPYVTSAERIGIEKGIQQGIKQGIEQGIKQGIEQGIEQGIQQGARQGEAALLIKLLERRFGPLPRWASERIERAERPLLEEWGLRVLEAGSLEEVFRD